MAPTKSLHKVANSSSPRLVEASAVIEFIFDPEICRAILDALKLEALSSSERFVRTSVEVVGESLKLNLRAVDLTDLRAGVNSYFNLVKASSETLSSLL